MLLVSALSFLRVPALSWLPPDGVALPLLPFADRYFALLPTMYASFQILSGYRIAFLLLLLLSVAQDQITHLILSFLAPATFLFHSFSHCHSLHQTKPFVCIPRTGGRPFFSFSSTFAHSSLAYILDHCQSLRAVLVSTAIEAEGSTNANACTF